MNRRKFNLLTRTADSDETGKLIQSYYSSWRTGNRMMNAPFVALYNSFKDEHLASLEGGPLKLYLYFSFHANNSTGHSWHSIQTIAKFFKTQTRTIDNWIKVLVEKELIYRERTDKLSNTTFLIPYSNALMPQAPMKKHESDNQELLDDLISVIQTREGVYGEIVGVYHLFQWSMKKGEVNTEDSIQLLLILTKRSNGIVLGHTHRLSKLSDYGISELDVEDIAIFNSNFIYNGETVKGIALDPSMQIRLRKYSRDLLDLCEQLAEAEEIDFDSHFQVEYGLISDVLEGILDVGNEEKADE